MRREAWHENEEPFAIAKRGLRVECHIKPTVVGGLPKGRPDLGKPARRVGAPLLSETPANGWRRGAMRHADGHRPVGTLHTPPRSNLAPSQQLNNLKNKKSSFFGPEAGQMG